MADSHHQRQIRYPAPEDADQLLRELGLDSLPSQEQLHDIIEKQWLTPNNELPDHWLSQYQV